MKSKVKIWAVLLSAAVMFGGCGKSEVIDNTEVNSLKKSIIASIDKHIERLDGQIASASEEFAAMRDSDKYPEEDMRALEEKLSALSKELSDIKDSASGLADLDADFTDAADKVNSALASLDAGLDTVRAMIAKLKQDAADTDGDDVVLCYVPKYYDDRPDSLHYHLDGLKILGDITLRFVSQTQEAAKSLAENWETELSAYAIYIGNEYDLTITGVTATGVGLLLVSISADSLPRNFINGGGYADVKIMCEGKPIPGSIRLAAVDESDVLNMLNWFDYNGDGQVVDNLGEVTDLPIYSWNPWILPYLNLLLAEMPALTYLNCGGCNLTNLNLSHCPALKTLDCRHNSLTTLDLSNCPALKTLYCHCCSLAALDLSHCPALDYLSCGDNSLTTLDVSNCPALRVLDGGDNSLTTLDLSHCPALAYLCCDSNSLTTLDLSNCPALTELYCNNNSLTALDLSNCPVLTTLSCDHNSLTTLDLSNYTSLSKLSVDLTTKLIVSAGFSVGQAYSLVGQYVSVDGIIGVVCEYRPVRIISTDEISASWEDAKDWCTSKGPDWYLPTLDDFLFWYDDLNRTLSSIGGVELDMKSYYWSSDYCDTGAYGYKYENPAQVYDTGTVLKVRAVRAL